MKRAQAAFMIVSFSGHIMLLVSLSFISELAGYLGVFDATSLDKLVYNNLKENFLLITT
jgi:hypothetical protein